MTATYTPDSATYAWSQSDRQYGRSYVAPAARPGWYDGYSPMDRPNYMATPGPVVPSSNSTALRKGAMAAALLTAIVGGAVLGTFVLANSTSSPNPSVYMVPETSGPAPAPVPVAAPSAPGGPTTVVVPGRTVIVPPANRGPVPAFVPAPAPMPPAPRLATVPPPPPPPAPAAPPQIRIEGIPIPIPMPGQPPANQGENNQQQQQQQTPGDKQDECTMVPDLPYCNNQGGTSSGGGTPSGGGSTPTGGAGGSGPSPAGFDPTKQKGETGPGDDQRSTPGATDPAPFDPDKILPQPPCILGICP
ncbi:MAG TPA: hypothetical protein VKA77_17510 [Mycobacterium sp.]|nr:hypothetical protein [Mycobacterium sp.]